MTGGVLEEKQEVMEAHEARRGSRAGENKHMYDIMRKIKMLTA